MTNTMRRVVAYRRATVTRKFSMQFQHSKVRPLISGAKRKRESK